MNPFLFFNILFKNKDANIDINVTKGIVSNLNVATTKTVKITKYATKVFVKSYHAGTFNMKTHFKVFST